MKATIGDRIVVVPPHIGGVLRDCIVVELRTADGSPPYIVRWSDTGQEALYFPGSDGRVEHAMNATPAAAPESTGSDVPHVSTWRVEIQLFGYDGQGDSARGSRH